MLSSWRPRHQDKRYVIGYYNAMHIIKMRINCAIINGYSILTVTSQLWDNFSAIKHTIRGCYHSNWKLSSGKNEDDAILLCSQHHWTEKRNKVIKSANKKSAQKNPPEDLRPLMTIESAPSNLNQSHNLFPEAVLYLLIKDHPIIIQGDSPKRKGVVNLTAGPADEEEDEDEEEKLGRGMSTKGSFSSRKKQKQADTRLKKRALVGRKNQASGMREKAALIHASAAKKQADNQLAQTRLAAIESATKLGGMPKELLQGFMKETLSSLFAIQKSSESATAAATSSSDVETERASAAMVAAEQLSMMSARVGVAVTVSGSESDIEVVE